MKNQLRNKPNKVCKGVGKGNVSIGKGRRGLRAVVTLTISLAILLIAISGCASAETGDSQAPENSPPTGGEAQGEQSNANSSTADAEAIHHAIAQMSLEEKVGQLLMLDFRQWKGQNVTIMDEEIASVIRDYHIGGIILFRENIENRRQTAQLIKDFQSHASIPLMIGIDQEGGLVTRISYAPRMPGNMALGATGDLELARKVGLAIASELRGLGIQVNFGPVIDVNNNPDNPVIGVRAFGDDPEQVAAFGMAYMEGLLAGGVAAVGKHYPGHGDVDLDSHYVLPHSDKQLSDLEALELVPFQRLIDEGIPGIMSAHITFQHVDPSTAVSAKDGLPIELPATLSYVLMTELLREQLGFHGVLFSDAMDMNAISNHFGPVEAAIRAVEAGIDVVLMPESFDQVYHGLLAAVHEGRLTEARINESVARILTLKEAFAMGEETDQYLAMEDAEIRALEQEVANAAVTVVHNHDILPLDAQAQEKLVIVGSNRELLQRMVNGVQGYQWRVDSILVNRSTNLSGTLSQQQQEILATADKVIIVTNSATQEDNDRDHWQVQTYQSIIDQALPSIVIAARNPYDAVTLTGMDAFIAQYDSGIAASRATSAILFGELEAAGHLPVKLPTRD